jgi:hypothetical protein
VNIGGDRELQLWSIDVARRSHKLSRTVYVAAPDVLTAVITALEDFDDDAWEVSAMHKYPVHKIVTHMVST